MFAKSTTTSQCSTRLAMGSCQEENCDWQMVLLELKRSLIAFQLTCNPNYLYILVFRRSLGWLLRSLIISKTVLKIINDYLWSTYLFWSFMVIEKDVVQHWFVVLDVQNLKKSECSTSHLLFSFWNFEFFCGVDGQEPSPCSQSPHFDLKEINHFLSLTVGSHLWISSILPAIEQNAGRITKSRTTFCKVNVRNVNYYKPMLY